MVNLTDSSFALPLQWASALPLVLIFMESSQLASSFHRDYLPLVDRDEGVKAQVVQSELGEIERDLTLHRLLWELSEELTKLVEEWTATIFEQLKVESLQKNVNRFTQTVYMLEKGEIVGFLLALERHNVLFTVCLYNHQFL